MLIRKDHLGLLHDTRQLEIIKKESAHLSRIIEKLSEEKSILEKEQDNLGEQKKLLNKEWDLLANQIQTLEVTKKSINKLSFEDRIGLIKLDASDRFIMESSGFICPISHDLFQNPIALNEDDRHLIDESSIPQLIKAKDDNNDDYYVHPFIPGFEVYENDTAKKGGIVKKILGKITSFTPMPEVTKKIEAFVLQAEQKYYINESVRINERQEQIRKELFSIENRETEILLVTEQLNQRIQSANTEVKEATHLMHSLHEKIELQNQIEFYKKQVVDLEMSISELGRVMKEDKMEQSEIDESLIPKILELESLQEILSGLEGGNPAANMSSLLQKKSLGMGPLLLIQGVKYSHQLSHFGFFKPVSTTTPAAIIRPPAATVQPGAKPPGLRCTTSDVD